MNENRQLLTLEERMELAPELTSNIGQKELETYIQFHENGEEFFNMTQYLDDNNIPKFK